MHNVVIHQSEASIPGSLVRPLNLILNDNDPLNNREPKVGRNRKQGQPDDLIPHDIMEINRGGVAKIVQSDHILEFFCFLSSCCSASHKYHK